MKIRIRTDGGRRASVLAWLAALLGAGVLVALTAAAGVWSMLRAGPDVAALRECVVTSTGFRKEIELRVGPVVFGVVRAGLNFIELEPEVRSALGAVRGTSVGVYRLEAGLDRPAMIEKVDQAMTRRGWERMVGVMEGKNTVLVYAPAKISTTRNLRLSLLVLDGEQLVLASVRGNPEPIFELLLDEVARHCPGPHTDWRGSAKDSTGADTISHLPRRIRSNTASVF
jgi:hypothetical protein